MGWRRILNGHSWFPDDIISRLIFPLFIEMSRLSGGFEAPPLHKLATYLSPDLSSSAIIVLTNVWFFLKMLVNKWLTPALPIA